MENGPSKAAIPGAIVSKQQHESEKQLLGSC